MANCDDSLYMRVARINAKKGLLPPLKHNLREHQKERGARSHIDVSRSHLNYQLEGLGDAEQINEWANSLIQESGAKVRANASLAVEIVFSLPAHWHERDTKPYFEDCLQWVKGEFEGLEILDFSVHLDEGAPHAHVLILSLKDGKLRGDEIAGGLSVLARRQDSFYNQVAHKYGLKRASARYSAQELGIIYSKVSQVIELKKLVPNSEIYSLVLDEVRKNPVPYAQSLGIDLPEKKAKRGKTFVGIMTKPVKSL